MFTLTSLSSPRAPPRSGRAGRDGVARAAPFRPEVDEHRLVALRGPRLERRFGDCSCHSVVPFHRGLRGSPLPVSRWTWNAPPYDSRIAHGRSSQPLPPGPDHPALEREILALVGRGGSSTRLRERNSGGPKLELHRRADHREQPDGRPPRLGPHAQGRLPALQGAARLRPALPERLRLPGPLGRGRRREGARPQLEARDRGVRARRVRRALPRARRRVRAR